MREKDSMRDTHNTTPGELWTAALIGFVWQWNHQLWNKRNEETPKSDDKHGSAREKLEAASQTRAWSVLELDPSNVFYVKNTTTVIVSTSGNNVNLV
jgi:hypothetical protein